MKLEMIDRDVAAEPRPLRLVVRRRGRSHIGNWVKSRRLVQKGLASWRRISEFRR